MKYRPAFALICFSFFSFLTLRAQYRTTDDVKMETAALTGNLNYDLMGDAQRTIPFDSSDIKKTTVYTQKYSPLNAALYSAVIPGAGQFYTKSYLQSAAFFGSEVLLWVVYAIYENKGDNKTDEFENFADEHWSVVRYAYWIQNYYNQYYSNSIFLPGPLPFPDVSQPWTYINWDELNRAESSIGGDQTIQPTGFTHQLAPHGDQQYYEMIGKYSQFGGGWDDATSFTRADVLIGNVSPKFLSYSQMRGDANSFYDIATTVSYVIVVNHLFSALEAAWNASRINHKIQLEGHIQSRRIYGNLVEFVPTVNMKLEL